MTLEKKQRMEKEIFYNVGPSNLSALEFYPDMCAKIDYVRDFDNFSFHEQSLII